MKKLLGLFVVSLSLNAFSVDARLVQGDEINFRVLKKINLPIDAESIRVCGVTFGISEARFDRHFKAGTEFSLVVRDASFVYGHRVWSRGLNKDENSNLRSFVISEDRFDAIKERFSDCEEMKVIGMSPSQYEESIEVQ